MRLMTITGRLTAVPEYNVYDAKNGDDRVVQRLTFSVANNDNGKDADPEYYDVVCWGKLAEWGNQYLKKGTRVLLSGTPHNEIYESKTDNKRRTHFKLTCERVEMIG